MTSRGGQFLVSSGGQFFMSPDSAPVQDIVKLLGAPMIDFTWVAQAPLASMAAISIQDDANVARRRLLFELVKEPALVNPVKKTQERRCGGACFRRLSLRGVLPGLELGRGSLLIKA